MTGRIVVVGAGPSGLGCAIAAAARHDVEVVDRLPVCGGETGWRHPGVGRLVRRAEVAGVRFRLGWSALRWDGRRLLVVSPGRCEAVVADTLFYAGGLRPGTAIDLGLTGERPAGVLAATVAAHLLESGAPLWRTPILLGDGAWGRRIADLVHAYGGRVTAVGHGHDGPAWADVSITTTADPGLVGRTRVEGVDVVTAQGRRRVAGDAVILAGTPRPNRNVDGAVDDPSPGVIFVQPVDVTSVDGRSEQAARIARAWSLERGGTA